MFFRRIVAGMMQFHHTCFSAFLFIIAIRNFCYLCRNVSDSASKQQMRFCTELPIAVFEVPLLELPLF